MEESPDAMIPANDPVQADTAIAITANRIVILSVVLFISFLLLFE
jgi:hypothetical protein